MQSEEVTGKRFTKHSEWLNELDAIEKTSGNKEISARAAGLAKALVTIINIRQAPSDKQHEYHKAKEIIGRNIADFLKENS